METHLVRPSKDPDHLSHRRGTGASETYLICTRRSAWIETTTVGLRWMEVLTFVNFWGLGWDLQEQRYVYKYKYIYIYEYIK